MTDSIEHKKGCPATRVESYELIRPATEEQPEMPVRVTRCIDCSEQIVSALTAAKKG